MEKKMWHCKYCGNTQDASEPVCRGCGNDLVIYGDIVFADTPQTPAHQMKVDYQPGVNYVNPPVNQQGMSYGGAPVNQQPAGFGGYQQGMNNGGVQEPPYGMNNQPVYPQNAIYDFDNNGQGKKGGKKGMLALIAVAVVAIVAVVAVLLLVKGKDDGDDRTTRSSYSSTSSTTAATTTTKPSTTNPTTTKPTTTRPSTTNPTTPDSSNSTSAVSVPSFYAFAKDHMVKDLEYTASSDGTVDIYTYYMKKDYIHKIAIEYIKLLVNKYKFSYTSDNIISGEDTYAVMFDYKGSGNPGTFQYNHNGTYYSGELFLEINFATGVVTFCVSGNGIDINDAGDRTTYDVVDFTAPVLPDFEEFAYDYILDFEDDSSGSINDFYYTLPASEGEAIIDEYADLILDYHNFDVIQSLSDKNWIGLEFCGSQDVETFVTTFGDGSKSESTAVTLSYKYDSDGNIVFNLAYTDDIRIVRALLSY